MREGERASRAELGISCRRSFLAKSGCKRKEGATGARGARPMRHSALDASGSISRHSFKPPGTTSCRRETSQLFALRLRYEALYISAT
jgi:hypothetical protein